MFGYTVSLILLLFVPMALAGERVLTDDGREVMLGDDGRWELVSEDRFATTASGERVRLSPDGHWEIVSQSDAARHATVQPAADTGPAHWSLAEVTIETARGQRNATKKKVTKQTHTVFQLRAKLNAAESGRAWTLQPDDVRVVDSGGREYPIISLAPGTINLSPDVPAELQIRVDGSPHWFSTRYFEVRIAEQTVENTEEVRLKRALSNVQKRDVDKLPQ